MSVPILFIVFNRPETTAQVFGAIRAARPDRLYVAADGPRPGREGEAESVAKVRTIATAVDWPCDLRILFRESNLGCKRAVSSAISWFFENEPEGIVLEDDTVPLPSFFAYAEEMLERYRHDDRVMMVNGSNLVSRVYKSPQSYFFSAYAHVWGWASWRRTWRNYDVAIADWPELRRRDSLADIALTDRNHWMRNWHGVLDATHEGKIDTWDYQLALAIMRCRGLVTTPQFNLVRNIGFGSGATHTQGAAPRYISAAVTAEIDLPLTHPREIARDIVADRLHEVHVQEISWRNRLIARIASHRIGAMGLRQAQRGKVACRWLVEFIRA